MSNRPILEFGFSWMAEQAAPWMTQRDYSRLRAWTRPVKCGSNFNSTSNAGLENC